MTENIWDRFDDIVDANEVEEASASFDPLEEGDYTVKLEEAKTGENPFTFAPQLELKFRTDKNRVVFVNQALQNPNFPDMTAMLVGITNSLVNGLRGEKVAFTSVSELAKRVETIEIGRSYNVHLSYGDKDLKKKYPKLKIKGFADEAVQGLDGDEEVPL